MADKHQGWILLYRSIRDHWIWNRDRVFDQTHAWIDILLDVNHEERKIILDGRPMIIGRGQKWTSARTLADRWGWSVNKVRRFLSCLECDSMVTLERHTNGTLLTVVNYDNFQIAWNTNGTPTEHERNTNGTPTERNKELKELNNKKNNKTRPIRSIQNFKTTDTDYDDLAYQIMNKPT